MKRKVLNLLFKEVLPTKYRKNISWRKVLGRFHIIKKKFNPKYGTNFWAEYEQIGESLSYRLKYVRVRGKNGPIVVEMLDNKKAYKKENFHYISINEELFPKPKLVASPPGIHGIKKNIPQDIVKYRAEKYLHLKQKGNLTLFFRKVVGIHSLRPLKSSSGKARRAELIRAFNNLFGLDFDIKYINQEDGSKKIKVVRTGKINTNGKIIFPGEPVQLKLF